MATQITVPNLTLSQDARLYKYVRLPSGWKYLRADYSENFGLKPHSVFLPKTSTPTVIEGGKYVASDGGKWHPLSPDPNEAWMLFKLFRNEGRKSQLEVKSQQLRQQLATGKKTVVQEEKPKVLTVGDAIEIFLKSYWLKILSGGRKPRTYDAIEDILVAFKAAIGEKTPLAAVTRESAITCIATLKKRTGADTTKTTKENHFIYIQKMLRASGVNVFEEGDCPKAPSGSSEDIRVYSDDELKRIFDVASDYHRMCWKTFLMSGVREEEEDFPVFLPGSADIATSLWRDFLSRLGWLEKWPHTRGAKKKGGAAKPQPKRDEKTLRAMMAIRLGLPAGGRKHAYCF
jgi:hypothetical protein